MAISAFTREEVLAMLQRAIEFGEAKAKLSKYRWLAAGLVIGGGAVALFIRLSGS